MGTDSREAYEAYLRGRHCRLKRTEEDIGRAVAYFRAAIDADPAYAAAYAGLADCYNQLATVLVGQSPAHYCALELNPSYGSARVWPSEYLIMRRRYDAGGAA